MLASLRQLLANQFLYVALQKGVGADRVRYRCLDEAELKPGERVLDVGCGPAYYFDRLPDVEYHGFDTSPAYIAHARGKYGDRGEFHCEVLTAARLAQLPRFDAVLLFGLLHHLDDEQSATLLDLAANALARGGRVISVDPCLHPGQGRVSRWMSENDRGEYVRAPEGFTGLARASFGEVSSQILDTVSRVPSSHFMMRMSAPLVGAGA
ncbi:MAG TPA: class I SAM-dependent methyltransferase [Micromonosporaceae bacterium]